MAGLIKTLHNAALTALQPYMRLTRGMTLGVRVLVRDGEGKVLLVRHSYMPGWTLPGGGVDPGERLGEAVERELLEETGVELAGEPHLHGVFANFVTFPRDYIAVYVVDDWHLPNGFRRSLEIIEHGFFAVDALPENTAAGARRRIAEIIGGAMISADW